MEGIDSVHETVTEEWVVSPIYSYFPSTLFFDFIAYHRSSALFAPFKLCLSFYHLTTSILFLVDMSADNQATERSSLLGRDLPRPNGVAQDHVRYKTIVLRIWH